MARSVNTDFFQNMYFTANAIGPDGATNFLDRTIASGVDAPAGFASVSVPSISNGTVEYREGGMIYTRKYPGIPSVDDITMSRGVARLDSAFHAWMTLTNEGQGDYRADVDIFHYHRAVSLTRTDPPVPGQPFSGKGKNLTKIAEDATPGRIYHVREAFASYVKLGSDLAGTDSEVSMQEITVTYEFCEITENDF